MDDVPFGHRQSFNSRPNLARFRSGQPNCSVALWIDIDAQIILAADSDLLHPQENLDAMCASAAQALSFPPLENGTPPHQVIFSNRSNARVVLRDPACPSQALVSVCSPEVDLKNLTDGMAIFVANPEQIAQST